MSILQSFCGEEKTVSHINGSTDVRKYLANFGIIEGRKIAKAAYGHGINIYYIDDSFLALRDHEAALIEVEG